MTTHHTARHQSRPVGSVPVGSRRGRIDQLTQNPAGVTGGRPVDGRPVDGRPVDARPPRSPRRPRTAPRSSLPAPQIPIRNPNIERSVPAQAAPMLRAVHPTARDRQPIHVRRIDADRIDADRTGHRNPTVDRRELFTTQPTVSSTHTQMAVVSTARTNAAVRRGTRAFLRIVALLMTTVLGVAMLYAPGAEAEGQAPETVLHVVQPGDTLWSLASRYTPSGGDVRTTVESILLANELRTSTVQVGSQLEIPVRR